MPDSTQKIKDYSVPMRSEDQTVKLNIMLGMCAMETTETELDLKETDNRGGPLQFFARHQQTLKWIVYTLLILNFGYYLFDDWRAAQSTLLPDVGSLCALLGEDLYFLRNLLYELIDAGNCTSLSTGGEIYRFVGEPVVSDGSGYRMAVGHAWVDVIEIAGWLTISLLLTFVMVLQNKGIYASPWIRGADRLQYESEVQGQIEIRGETV